MSIICRSIFTAICVFIYMYSIFLTIRIFLIKNNIYNYLFIMFFKYSIYLKPAQYFLSMFLQFLHRHIFLPQLNMLEFLKLHCLFSLFSLELFISINHLFLPFIHSFLLLTQKVEENITVYSSTFLKFVFNNEYMLTHKNGNCKKQCHIFLFCFTSV